MKKLCVFAGSSPGRDPLFMEHARQLGELCADAGWGIVNGGGGQGMMLAVADGALSRGGHVEGVIPHSMVLREWAHNSLTDLHVVETMHQRKQRMHDRCDAFVALPGGIGTLDEVCEALAWQKLEIHKKPVAVLNTLGFYESFLHLLDHTVECGFYHALDRERLWVTATPQELITRLNQFTL
ncbi:MAG: TIGR00730 family Rossman fold protein [Candidatus Eremiobacteraeota bacterium]|nr:TIGR00730 family Rossman fold protein [Candidatus Eremiobacteraeota bacterium]MCW5869433.1 TIGR00730 family Rossman fold protein [Candidatus Eremiobacteraeota bacterium]